MMRKLILTLLWLLAFTTPGAAQLGSVPYTFSPGQTIYSAEVNANFSTVYANALNRTGGTMSGTLNVANVEPLSHNIYSLGTTGNRFANIYATTFTGSGTGLTGVALLASSNTFGGGSNSTVQIFQENDSAAAPLLVFKRKAASTGSTYGGLRWRDGADATLLGFESGAVGASGWEWNTYSGGTPTLRMSLSTSGVLGVDTINATSTMALQTGGTTRWGISSNGDFTVTSSANIFASVATPTINSGGGSGVAISGKDYAFTITLGSTPTSPIVVDFGRTWTNSPICVANGATVGAGRDAVVSQATTTQVTIVHSMNAIEAIKVVCLGR